MEALIEEVRSRPVIWDTTLDIYRDQVMKNAAWEEIAANLQNDKFQLMSEWKKLRDRHRHAVNRRRTTTGQAATKIKKWTYEDEMQFVLKTMVHRPSKTNVPLEDVNEDEEHLPAERPQQDITTRDTGDESDVDFDENIHNEANEVESTQRNDQGMPKERRHRPAKGVDKVLSFMKGKEEKKQIKSQPDELDHFFASAAQSTRKLPRLVQIKLKRNITNMICEAEEQCELERNRNTQFVSRTPTPTVSPSYSSSSTRQSKPSPQPQRLGLFNDPQQNSFAASQWVYDNSSHSTGNPQELSSGSNAESSLLQTGHLFRNASDQYQ